MHPEPTAAPARSPGWPWVAPPALLALSLAPLLATQPPVAAASPSQHWSFQPVAAVEPPTTRHPRWVQTPIDAFIVRHLEDAGLEPAPAADKTTWLRRVTFDLVGLPPAPAEIDTFLSDQSPDACARVVDRLLASPRYGERWGRRWLDVARYADSNGQDENKSMSNAWRYRDYVIRACNDDKPYDQFIREQLAGDLLADPKDEPASLQRLVATGFLVLGPKMLAEQDKPKLVMDVVDEQIDVVSRAFLGLTVSCCRCHDHKTDPLPTRDYYALAGIFKSTKSMEDLAFVSKWNERPIATAAERERQNRHARRTNELARAIAAARQAAAPTADTEPAPTPQPDPSLAALEAELADLMTNAPLAFPMALAVAEGTPADIPVHFRGNHLTLGTNPVPRGFPAALSSARTGDAARRSTIGQRGSGRLELAAWLTDPAHPLTARIAVNRIWQGHFGEGLVRSPDNFGTTGERPSHPDLLDWLAGEFVRGGWSSKHLHRLIALSSTYRMNSIHRPAAAQFDPDNRLLWRMNRQRLDAESLRDALLAAAGQLDLTMGGTLVPWKNAEYAPEDTVSSSSRRRAVYLPIVRDRVYDVFTTFDFANPSVATAQRTPTVVAHQALFFLNSPLVKDQARHLASAVAAHAGPDQRERITAAYRRILGRSPSLHEIARARQFLATVPTGSATASAGPGADPLGAWTALCQALFASNEFLYVN